MIALSDFAGSQSDPSLTIWKFRINSRAIFSRPEVYLLLKQPSTWHKRDSERNHTTNRVFSPCFRLTYAIRSNKKYICKSTDKQSSDY